MRQNGVPSTSIAKRVTIVIEKSFAEFDAHDEEILRHALASFLQIPIDAIGIIETREGSVHVLIELPGEAANRLLEAFKANDSRLEEHLPIFPLSAIIVESGWGESAETLSAKDQITETSIPVTSSEGEARRDYEELFERVFEDRYPVVLLFFTRKGIAAEAARELAQETFLKLYRVGSSKPYKELDSLVFGIVREVYRAHKDAYLGDELERERQRIFQDALEELPGKMRQAVFIRTGELEAKLALRDAVEASRAKLFVSQLIERKLLRLSNGRDRKEP